MAIGAAGLAPLSDRLGRRLLLVSAMFLIGLSMLAVSLIADSKSIAVFAVLRFLSGLGIGIIFGSAPALVSEFMPGRFRSLAVSVVVMGYPVGAVLAGPIANALIPEFGWASVFTAGGLLTICMGLLTLALLPESPEFLAGRAGSWPDRATEVNKLLGRMRRAAISDIASVVPAVPIGDLKHQLRHTHQLTPFTKCILTTKVIMIS